MRIDLVHGGKRPKRARIGLGLVKRYTGVYPAPPFTASYRPDLWHRDFVGYFLRSMHGSGGWDKGHAELFATFVSDLNTCHF